MAFIFTIGCILLTGLSCLSSRRVLNVVAVLIIPYAVLAPVNNYIMTGFGFYPINDEVLWMLLGAFVCFFLGSAAVDSFFSLRQLPGDTELREGRDGISNINWNAMFFYALAVSLITFLRLAYYVRGHGLAAVGQEAFSGYLTSGIPGHIFLSSAPLVPVMFYYWLKNPGRIRYLLAVLCLTGLFFMTLVKYHVISVAIATYFLAAIEEKKYLKTGGLLLGAAGTSVFVLNYFISFLVRGVAGNIDNSFYMNHFWNYAAGSLVYDNRIFINGIRTDVSIFYKLGSFVAAPVNLFLYGLFGLRLFPHDTLKHYLVASNGEKGNVVDAIGYLFPSKGSMVDILVFGIVILLLGALFSWIYHSLYLKSIRENRLPVMLAYFMTYFVFLSFFGTFYINLVPYEILFWCWVMMFVFDKRNIFIA